MSPEIKTCPQGHALTPENTRLEWNRKAPRYRCKTCVSLRMRQRYQADPILRARHAAYNKRWYRENFGSGHQAQDVR